MAKYGEAFKRKALHVAQILLNQEDMENRARYLNARNTIEHLLDKGVVPIINENDTTAVDELQFGDNDVLSSRITAKMQADLLVIMTNVDGLFNGNPSKQKNAELIPVIKKITEETFALCHSGKSFFGLGGMQSKIKAAKLAGNAGAYTIIMNGKSDTAFASLREGKIKGTVFIPPPGKKLSARSTWIALGAGESQSADYCRCWGGCNFAKAKIKFAGRGNQECFR